MPDGYLVTAETIRKLRADHDELRTQLKVLQNSILRAPPTSVAGTAETLALAKLTDNIGGYTLNGVGNAVLESGQADVYTLRPDGELVSLDRSVDVYNGEVDDLTLGTFVSIQRHYMTGKWVVDRIGAAGTTLHRVKLKESMGITVSQEASADLYSLAGVDSGEDITVLDPDNLFPAALGPRTSPADPLVTLPGAAGMVMKSGAAYYAMELEQAARMIIFETLSATSFTTTDTHVEVFSNNYWHGQQPGATTNDSGTAFFVYNFQIKQTGAAGIEHLFEGGENSVGLAVWDDRAVTTVTGAEVTHPGLYRIIQMGFECPT
jgi:hypothetical protein